VCARACGDDDDYDYDYDDDDVTVSGNNNKAGIVGIKVTLRRVLLTIVAVEKQ
jgi:hypothetical protein